MERQGDKEKRRQGEEETILVSSSSCGRLGRREGNADNLLVVPHEGAAVGESRVRPDDFALEGVTCRLQNVRPAQLLISPRCQPGDDKVPLLIGQEEAVPILDDEDIG